MQNDPCPPSGLYPDLLGDSWARLHRAVQSLHDTTTPVRAVGVFRVRRGSNRLARALAWLARLPKAQEAVAIELWVTPRADGEEWRRSFAGRPLVSRQAARRDGLLAERMGGVETRFRLAVADGALSYQTVSAALCLGPLRVPLPRWVRPRATAWERPAGQKDQLSISVEVYLPGLGLLIAYEGTLTIQAPG
jgi:hypothetical protein